MSYWHTSSALLQSIAAVLVIAVLFYIIRFVVLRRLGRVAAKTDNDFDDRLIHFLKLYLWLTANLHVELLVLEPPLLLDTDP